MNPVYIGKIKGEVMGFDMYITKAKKSVFDNICKKYFQKDIYNLPYEVFEELETESYSKLFTSCVNILRDLEENFLYANDTYVFLNKRHYDLILSHCGNRMEYLKQYIDNDFLDKRFEYIECERLFYWLQGLNLNFDEDVLLYEYDC